MWASKDLPCRSRGFELLLLVWAVSALSKYAQFHQPARNTGPFDIQLKVHVGVSFILRAFQALAAARGNETHG